MPRFPIEVPQPLRGLISLLTLMELLLKLSVHLHHNFLVNLSVKIAIMLYVRLYQLRQENEAACGLNYLLY